MKPFLGINVTDDKKNTVENGEELIYAKPSPDLTDALVRASVKVRASIEKAKLPRAIRIVEWIAHFIVGVVVIGVLRSTGGEDGVTLSQILEKMPWIFIVGGVALVIGVTLHFIGKRKASAVLESDESVHNISSLDSVCASIFSDLGVPDNAREIDLFSVTYKEKNGEVHIVNAECNNPVFKIFADKDYFYFANLSGKYQFSRDSVRKIRKINKNIIFRDWNKDEAYNSDKYRKFKIAVDKYDRIHCKPCYILELNVDGKLWGIYFPPYELPLFEALTGLKAE